MALQDEARFCGECGRPTQTRLSGWLHQTWWRTFLVGLALYALTFSLLSTSGNPNFIPTVILLGALLVPVTYVAYLYESGALWDVSPVAVGLTLLYGGVLGTVAAQLIEQELVVSMGLIGMATVGVSEELVKLLGLVWLARKREYFGELHGIVLGAAAGMGFAALETMGYALTYLIVSQGQLDVLATVLVNRGLLSPFAHGTWTAILAGTLWRERQADGRFRINGAVLKAFVLVVVLHGLWDWTNSSIPIELSLPSGDLRWRFVDLLIPSVSLPIPGLLIGLWGIYVLTKMLREARRKLTQPQALLELPPQEGGSQADAR
jgi:protease PrsW